MEFVGGYSDFLALCEDEHAFNDVMIALAGQAEADTIRKLESSSESW